MIKVEHSKLTVYQQIEGFLIDKKSSVTSSTLHSYKNHLGVLSSYADFNKELDKSVCQEIVDRIADLDISEASRNSYLRTWKTFVKWTNLGLPVPKIKEVESVKKTYSDEDIKKLIAPPKGNYDFAELRSYVITLLLFDTGLRASSILSILQEDVQDGLLSVRHTKTHKTQVVPFSEYTNKWLHKYAKYVHNYALLFVSQYGEPLTYSALAQSFRRYCRRRGVEPLGIHACRHTFAKKQLLDLGTNAFQLQRMLGHSTLNTTKIYCRLYDSEVVANYKSPVESLQRHKIQG